MAWYDILFPKRVDESTAAFKGKGDDAVTAKELAEKRGEGVEDIYLPAGFGGYGLGSFTSFYNRYINRIYESEVNKIWEYRRMAEYPEIADVIEDAVNEATQEDLDGYVLQLQISDNDLTKSKNTVKVLYKEFEDLFYNKLEIENIIGDLFRSYLTDGRLYYERVINKNKPKQGIVAIKKLPAETMDFVYDPRDGRILNFYQYLTPKPKRPATKDEAEKDDKIVVFNPEQIGFVDYGVYGKTKAEIFGYLEKARVPYNQLKLLETSVIIYRIVRSPERFVFKIDTGNMPKDKAMKFVEKVKTKFIKKQTYDPQTGSLTHEPEVLSILENFFLPQSADGRGSDITTVGGNAAGFTNLDDIYYFNRKLYRAMKYPMSRVTAGQEKREADIVVGGAHTGEISRDEIKWAKFLERQQIRVCSELRKLFLIHLEFKGLKQQYELDKESFRIVMTQPSHYGEIQNQGYQEVRFNNYNALANNEEFSKYYLMRKYLEWTDQEIEENIKAKKEKDPLLIPPMDAGLGGEGGEVGMEAGAETGKGPGQGPGGGSTESEVYTGESADGVDYSGY